MTDDSQAVRLFVQGTVGRAVADPVTVPCVCCGAERPYLADGPPAAPERRWWRLWRRAGTEDRCRSCGAL